MDRPNSFEDTGAWNSTAAIQDTWTSSSSSYRPDPGWGIAPLPKSQGGIIFKNLFFSNCLINVADEKITAFGLLKDLKKNS